jgi:lipocalin
MAAIAMSVATGVFFSTYVGFRIALGSCPTYEPITDFNVERFKGIWYEMQRDFAMATGECITA